MKFLVLFSLLFGVAYADVDQLTHYASYSGTSGAFTPPSTPTDLCRISGATGKVIGIREVRISTTQTTAGTNNFFIVKRSTDNTSGTYTGMTRVPVDSNSPAAGASVVYYSANPTLGTAVGNLASMVIFAPAPATAASGTLYSAAFDRDFSTQPIRLRSAAEMISVNFAGAALPPGLSVNCGFSWFEY